MITILQTIGLRLFKNQTGTNRMEEELKNEQNNERLVGVNVH